MRFSKQTIAFLILIAIPCGCVTKADGPSYYTLDMMPSGLCDAGLQIMVDKVRVTDELARRQILVQTSPTEIEYYALAEWAGSVDELVREKLEAEFGPSQPDAPVYLLDATVYDFAQDEREAASAHLRMAIEVHEDGDSRYGAPLLKEVYDYQIPTESKRPAAVAAALSRALEQAAVQIGKDLLAIQSPAN